MSGKMSGVKRNRHPHSFHKPIKKGGLIGKYSDFMFFDNAFAVVPERFLGRFVSFRHIEKCACETNPININFKFIIKS